MENNDIILEGSTAVWTLPPTNSDTGGTYTGHFTFRAYLDPMRQLQAGREYREFLGAHASLASDTESNISFALTQLKHRIIKAPPFWTSTMQDSGVAGNIGDLGIIALVLDRAIAAENLFKEKVKTEREAVLNRSIETAEKLLQKNSGEE